jgi:hypothetical protein
MVSPKSNFLFFDIETSGKKPWESSILSLAHTRGPTLYAAPSPGSKMYPWAQKNIWDPIATSGKTIGTEQQLLEGFLGQLENAPEGTRLAGWNIGTQVATGPGSKGFDVPFLLRRARGYGLEDRYRSALQKVRPYDVGAEYAYRIAESVEKHGPQLMKEGVLHKDMYEQAQGFMKQARIFSEQQGVPRSQLASELHRSGVKFAGWQLETVHKAMGFGSFAAHEAGADVRATQRLAEALPTALDEGFVRRWAPLALENKLVSGLKSPPWKAELATPERYDDIMRQAAAMETGRPDVYGDLSSRVLGQVREHAETVGGSMEDVRLGRGLRETGYRGGNFGRVAARAGLGEGIQAALETIGRHKGKIGVGVGVLGLVAAQPGTWFSGKDDEYNTIEGLRHGGYAQQMRRVLTDFGSGWIRKALSQGISRESVVKRFAQEMSDVGISGARKQLAGTGIYGLLVLLIWFVVYRVIRRVYTK